MTSEMRKIRFILVGLGRCGSNLLKFALKQHPDIEMAGELFNRHVFPEALSEDGATRAAAFFNAHDKAAVGFKLFRHHARKGPPKSVWDYLSRDEDIRVIHLYRRNYFKRILSWKIADKRGQWLADEHGTEDIRIELTADEWQALLELDAKKESFLDRTFQGHPTIKLAYEDLVKNWEEQTQSLLSFLAVSERPLQKKLKKQETKHPRDRCPNYPELVEHFASTPYAWMFE